MANHLTKYDIDKLTSKIKYSSFERGEQGCEELEFCSNIRHEFKQSYQIYDLHKISDKIIRALCFIYNRKKKHQSKFDEELCSYLYYWLGDIIYSKVKNQAVYSKIINMIYTELNNNIESITICNPPKSKINQDKFNKNKMLFDYSKDYHNFELATPHGETTCDKEYKEHMNNYISMYKQAHFDCNNGNKNNFDCDYFSTLFQENLYSTLSSFSCKQHDNIEVDLDKQKAHGHEQTAQIKPYLQAIATAPSSHEIAAQNADLDMNKHARGQTFPRSLELPQMDDATESGTSKTIAGSVAPVLGVSSISLLLYKVTPLGGFIRNFLGRNRNMYNPAEYMDSFNPYSDGMVPGDRRMNISYHRL